LSASRSGAKLQDLLDTAKLLRPYPYMCNHKQKGKERRHSVVVCSSKLARLPQLSPIKNFKN
jgi:hypothetical protein